jgi:hypothetical protein
MTLLSPKSAIFTFMRLSSSRFSGLRSLWAGRGGGCGGGEGGWGRCAMHHAPTRLPRARATPRAAPSCAPAPPPVHHHVSMAVLHAADDLLEEVARLILGQAPLLHNVIKQLATLHPQNRTHKTAPTLPSSTAAGSPPPLPSAPGPPPGSAMLLGASVALQLLQCRAQGAQRWRARGGARAAAPAPLRCARVPVRLSLRAGLLAGRIVYRAPPHAATRLHVLHDHINVGGGFDHFVQSDDVWVHEQAQDLDLSPHCRVPARRRTCESGNAVGAGGGGWRARGAWLQGPRWCVLGRASLPAGWGCALGAPAGQRPGPPTFLVHVHLLDLPPVQDLDRHLVARQHMLSYFDLQAHPASTVCMGCTTTGPGRGSGSP